MENNRKKRPVGIVKGKYTTEEINQIIDETKNHIELLFYYLDMIRNYREFSEEMIENIKNFDDNSKMILIIEYNKVITPLHIQNAHKVGDYEWQRQQLPRTS
jgi:fructose-1,6-bisphosphatase